MSAYLMGSIEITDRDLFAEYSKRVPAVVKQYGGRYLIRGGAVERLEGSPPDRRTVVIEFPDKEAVLRWYNSPEYAPLLEMRTKASKGDIAVVEGV